MAYYGGHIAMTMTGRGRTSYVGNIEILDLFVLFFVDSYVRRYSSGLVYGFKSDGLADPYFYPENFLGRLWL